MMQYIFLNQAETVQGFRGDATKFVVNEDKFSLNAEFPHDDAKPIEEHMLLGFMDIDGRIQFYEIRTVDSSPFSESDVIYAEHAGMTELLDEVIEDIRPTNVQAGVATTMALNGSRWSLKSAEPTGTASMRFYFKSRWKALQIITEKYGCGITFEWTMDDTGITGRNVVVTQRLGADRGKRFELGKDLQGLNYIYDDSSVYTALYGRGKGESTLAGDDTNTPRLTFEDVVWSEDDGDPADKPQGQKYVEDVTATALYGRNGRMRTGVIEFDDCEDAEELLTLTWEALQAVNCPTVTVKATVCEMESVWGFSHEAARLGDDVAIIDRTRTLKAQISSLSRDYVNPANTRIVIGTLIASIIDVQASLDSRIAAAKAAGSAGQTIAKANPELLNGYIDTMVTKILSTGTNRATDADGGEIYTTTDGTKAVKLTGSGILCASSKVGDVWQWRTAIDGGGIVADLITAGVLQANLVKILGTSQFYWDSGNIYIINPEDMNKQIRIGAYDGTNLGIGFTQDGGETWQNAIGFDGLTLQAGSITQDKLDPNIELGTIIYWLDTGGYNCVVYNPTSGTYAPNALTIRSYKRSGSGDAELNVGRLRFTCTYADNTTDTGFWDGDYSSWLLNITEWMEAATRTGKVLAKIQFMYYEAGGFTKELAQMVVNVAKDGLDGSGLKTFCQAATPTEGIGEGDLWVDTDASNKMYRYDGTEWVAIQDTHLDAIVIAQGTQIQQNAKAIALKASQTTVDALSGRVSTAESTLTVQAGQISSKVSAGDIASSINQTAQKVKILASKIDLAGYVTVTSLGSGGTTTIDGSRITTGTIAANRLDLSGCLTVSSVGAGGTTSIDGGRIKTGTVAAARIDVNNLYVKHLSAADGTFFGSLAYSSSGYTVRMGMVDGYSEPSIYPNVNYKCNVGTRYHAFDYMFANHFTDPSSITIKKNVIELKDGDYDIMAFRPISYEMKDSDTGLRSIGLIAEEVEEICPLLVTHDPKGLPCALEYSRFSVIAIREIQKLWREVQQLRQKVASLETTQK